MINKIKPINEKNTVDENIDLINNFKKELEISEEKIKETILNQNKEIFKIQNRLNSEVEKYQQFSIEKLIIEFLPIIDNIERAFNLMQQKKEKVYIKILKNIEYVLSLIKTMLNAFKVSKINDVKVIFDPNIHQAISIRYNNEIESNRVLEVMQSGYTYHSRLLRPAMVVVSTNKVNYS
ncbi:nucleotide exchange factor GrpE [Buchnera aphidicola (Aphis craccivora)]|uniref:GrpE protein homolog n=2 Tax=cellular organisms TaxID=131567 RepID=A0A6G0VV75_APHCR|nr:nucleotide exchange factor GrpE [Buchnera aphidicola]KAF0707670.1 grpE protein, mitochondrial [Aphis craccivora]QCI16501.1 nucleotide exchange factor GrpE [Buchnera aphidicola (Aphis craccivora)]QLL40638.1 nucleotide exchange factor GrpE [Buchnera aphidicola (Aphis craccivore)]WAI18012.1 MAG: nucleotide exchange factor GrpE [Buchnera aphidicola (Aphis craccivora)]